jgi:plasmid stabilization system protein ParE
MKKKYRVEFAATAKADVARSFEWGMKEWGPPAARDWYKLLRKTVRHTLSIVPLGYPLAPENSVYASEIRQMFVGRYRIIFSVERRTVRVLHVRGAFVDSTQKPFEDNDE